jgi:hypothetical protein
MGSRAGRGGEIIMWNYQREESEFRPIPEGKHRIRIKSAEKRVSKSGNDMLALQFEVSGYSSILYHYITFMPDKPEITNSMLTQFFDSFKDIPDGEFDTNKWIGKVGACQIKHEEYNDKITAKLHYFIKADKQKDLPPWKEPENKENSAPIRDVDVTDDLPF